MKQKVKLNSETALDAPELELVPDDGFAATAAAPFDFDAAPSAPTATSASAAASAAQPARPAPASAHHLDGLFRWPAPPSLAAYQNCCGWSDPQECDIVGLTGLTRPCTLFAMVPSEGKVLVQLDRARSMVSLSFAHFRRLILKQAIEPDASLLAADASAAEPSPPQSYRMLLTDGSHLSGATQGHVQTDYGIFFYTPVDDSGRLQREFLPRLGYQQVEVDGVELVLTPLPSESGKASATTTDSEHDRVLTEALVNNPEQLLHALELQSRMPLLRLGEALKRMGYITPEQLDRALDQQKTHPGAPLGQVLVEIGFITRKKLNAAMVRKMGYPMVDVTRFPIDPGALKTINMSTALRLRVLPLMVRGNLTVVAAADPTQRQIFEELEFLTQGRIKAALADDLDIRTATDNAYNKMGFNTWSDDVGLVDFPGFNVPAPPSSSELLQSMEADSQQSAADAEPEDEQQIAQSDNSLVKLINTMIIEAFERGVSDIHIESQPRQAKLRVRFRKDGVLSPYLELPHTYRSAMVARLKIMASLDISERRRPQDGKIDFRKFSSKHHLELRIATVPTANNLEDVVMRLLSSAKPVTMDKLGLSDVNLRQLRDAVNRPYGMVLCVGPTGSGKTTTLHSVLGHLNTPQRKIWTAEDPIEITQPDLRQVQVNPGIDWTFAKALRSFLRADPDVIMVGEIRDEETAHIAIEASLTGHLLLSTLHTNSAAETVTRLIDMGMNPFNFADSLLAVLAQRLVRKLCPDCRTSTPASADWVSEILEDYLLGFPDSMRPDRAALQAQWVAEYGQNGALQHYHCNGCPTCQNTGRKGRLGVHEFMRVTPNLRRLIQTQSRAELLQAEAFQTGEFRTLRQDGIHKVLAGLVSIDDVRANTNA